MQSGHTKIWIEVLQRFAVSRKFKLDQMVNVFINTILGFIYQLAYLSNLARKVMIY